MKLNYRRTICVGFAFFLICSFWQAYDTIIPKILTDQFGMSQAYSGIIMAIDNVLALFMLPLFGAISDKCKSPKGRRTPFIIVGTVLAAVLLLALSFVDNAQLKKIESVSSIDDPAAMGEIYDREKDAELKTPEGDTFVLNNIYSREDFCGITVRDGDGKLNAAYTNYVVPARQAAVHEITREDPSREILFIGVLCLLLLAMATFRSPAVALMPDVTVKPLRSKANAVINLMGTFGGIIVLGLGMAFATSKPENALISYTGFFGCVSAIMLLLLGLFLLTVKEPKLIKQMEADSKELGLEEAPPAEGEKRRLSKGERTSLFFILASIVLWFMGYNAVTSKYSVYAEKILGMDYNSTLLIAQVAAIISYLPVGFIASKVGRKKTILTGIVMLTVAFSVAGFLRADSPLWLMNVMFALAGIGWATINVNSFPMVVELCRGGDVGRYTGFYYTASMAAQTITPYISGKLMDVEGMTTLFPYAAVLVGLAFITMLFVKHGDSKPIPKKNLEAFDTDD